MEDKTTRIYAYYELDSSINPYKVLGFLFKLEGDGECWGIGNIMGKEFLRFYESEEIMLKDVMERLNFNVIKLEKRTKIIRKAINKYSKYQSFLTGNFEQIDISDKLIEYDEKHQFM